MNIGEYLGINYETKYTKSDIDNIFSKFNNLDANKFRIDIRFIYLLQKTNACLIKFINMFKDINEFAPPNNVSYSLAGDVIRTMVWADTKNQIHVYEIMDHMSKLNMDTTSICIVKKTNGHIKKYGIKSFIKNHRYINIETYETVNYMINNYNVIKNVRKITNNNDIILFNITDDL